MVDTPHSDYVEEKVIFYSQKNNNKPPLQQS